MLAFVRTCVEPVDEGIKQRPGSRMCRCLRAGLEPYLEAIVELTRDAWVMLPKLVQWQRCVGTDPLSRTETSLGPQTQERSVHVRRSF